MSNVNEGAQYASKMDAALSNAMKDWWQNLSKPEILQYLADQPAVTADFLRELLADRSCTLGIGVKFSFANTEAVADFHKVAE